jgi:hypothetical protein
MKKGVGEMITIFCLPLFSQLSFKLLFLSEEDRVKLPYFFELIFKNLGLCHPLYCNLQKLIFISRVFNHCLHKEKVRSIPRRCNKEDCQELTLIWTEVLFRLE